MSESVGALDNPAPSVNWREREQASGLEGKTTTPRMGQSALRSLVEVLQHQAATRTYDTYCYALAGDLCITHSLTYGDLYHVARQISHWLRRELVPGSQIMLSFDCGLEFIQFYFGVLLAGMMPVPLPPHPKRSRAAIEHAMARGHSCAIVLGGLGLRRGTHILRQAWPNLRILTVADFARRAMVPDIRGADIAPGDARQTAYIQYSSGTTSIPKAIRVSHANVLHNIGLIARAFGLDHTDVGVIWLPHYHDMGLVGGLLTPLVVGFPVYIMKPALFAADPLRWLRAISMYRATVSGGPDGAYQACARLVDAKQPPRLTLAQWRVAFTGAEPIKATTLRAFAAHYGEYGFQEASFLSCYGLAEATLMVTASSRGEAPACRRFERAALARGWAVPLLHTDDAGVELVSSGRAVEQGALLVFREESREVCRDWELGQIGVAGRSLAQGDPDQGQGDGARVTEAVGGRTYLLTGDLGFRTESGDIYVLGRWQDKMIVDGRNLFFADMEMVIAPLVAPVRKHVRALAVTACQEGNGIEIFMELTSGVSVFAHTEPDVMRHPVAAFSAAARKSAHALALTYGIGVRRVCLLRSGGMPRTSSGKVQRHRLQARGMEKYVLAEIALGDDDADVSGSELRLLEEKGIAEIYRDVLNTTVTMTPQDNFFLLGGGSIHATQALFRINARFGVALDIRKFVSCCSIRELAVAVALEQQRQTRSKYHA